MIRLRRLFRLLRQVRREMRHGIRGFGVFLTCLFLGVFAISAIGNFSAAARTGLLQDARALLGGDLELRLTHRPASEEQRTFLSGYAELSEILEFRTMTTIQASGERALVELKAVDQAYPLYGMTVLDSGENLAAALAPRPDELPGTVVEPAFLERFSAKVGDVVELGRQRFTIRAALIAEPDRSVRLFSLGPRVMISQRDLAATELVQPGSLINFSYRLKLLAETRAAAFKSTLQERFPDAGWRVRTWREAAPRVRSVLDRLETNLTLLGLCALLVGGLGITGAVRGYLSGKIQHIATMKGLGASGRTIFAIYLLQILLLGAIGSIGGLLAGAAFPWFLTYFFAAQLPVPLAPGFFPRVWLLSAAFGLLTALLFSLNNLGTACRVSPAILFRGYLDSDRARPGKGVLLAMLGVAATLISIALLSSADRRLAFWFIVGAAACFLLFRLLAGFIIRLTRRFPRSRQPALRLALANIQRPQAPAGGIIFSLGIGLTALVMIVQVQTNLNSMVNETLPKDAPAFFFFDIQPQQIDAFRKLFDSFPGETRVKYSPTLRGRITAIDGVSVDRARIDPDVRWAVRGDRFLSYAAELPQGAVLEAGDWWPADYQGPPLISLTSDLAKGFGIGIGDRLSVNILGRTITAEIANLRSADWSSLELNFALIFAPGILETAPHSYIAAAHLPMDGEQAAYRQVTGAFANVSAVSVREILANVSRTLLRIGWTFKGMAAIALLSGFLVLVGAVSADQHRRIRDAVIFKVCGATRNNILAAFAAEFVMLGLAAGAVSFLAGSLAAFAVLEGPLQADFQLQPAFVLLTLASGIALTLTLGLLGTWKALGQKTSAYLRED